MEDETGVVAVSRTKHTLNGTGVDDATKPEWSHIPLRGIRQFRVTPDGTLTGIAYTLPWQPGENVAECGHQPEVRSRQMGANGLWTLRGAGMRMMAGFGYDRPHSLRDCSHGFYSLLDTDYFDESGGPGYISAMIEGWGEAVVGPDGFRCGKAKIVALVMPNATDALGTIAEEKAQAEAPPPPPLTRRRRIKKWVMGTAEEPPSVVKWLQRHDGINPLMCIMSIFTGVGVAFGALVAPPFTLPLLVLIVPLGYVAWASAAADFSVKWGIGSDYYRQNNWPSELLAALDRNFHEPRDRADLIAEKYDVPVYKTVKAMLERHPIERGEA